MFHTPRAVIGVSLFASALAASTAVFADEGGVPFWFSGQYASLAAVPATPGWSMPTMAYYYDGDADSASFPRGDRVSAGLKSRLGIVLVQPTFAPTTKTVGGQLSIGLGFGYGSNETQADVSVSGINTEFNRSDSETGATDLYPVASIAWAGGVHNAMVYLTGAIPTGAYDAQRLANIGIGHGAVDAGGGYTYLNEKTGREFSSVVGLTYNFENSDTDYQNGVDSHLDWAASQFLSASWQVGIVGYAYYQLASDSGSGARFGSFKSKVAAVGPQIGYMFTMSGMPAYANVRGYWEYWAENRIKGEALFATVLIPLGPRKAH